MNESLLIDLVGQIDAGLLDDEYMENDLEEAPSYLVKGILQSNVMKVVAGFTAGSLIATGGIILAIKLHKGGLILPLIKNKG